MAQAKGLGKGLSALLGEQAGAPKGAAPQDNSVPGKQLEIKISDIVAWSKQPRQFFDEKELAELTNSIRKNGVVQPIIVRKAGDKYEIIAGERRWRASKEAGLKYIPAVTMELDDERALEIALVENIQRQDLKAIETAESYQRLIDEYDYTQEQLAEVLGKSRPAIANTLRLLALPDNVKQMLNEDKLTAGHARALVGSDFAEEIADRIAKQGLNVRQTEQLVKRFEQGMQIVVGKKAEKNGEIIELEREISNQLGFEIRIDDKNGKGKLTISYTSLGELKNILTTLKANRKKAA